jgi:hypothetical protein
MDREKVVKGLETCIPMKYETNEEKECRHEQCPYGRENYKPMNGCFWDLMSDALELLKEDCHNCKLECLLQKYDELKEKYDALLKEQEPLEPYACEGDMRCGNGCEIVGYIRESDGKIERLTNYCPYCGRPVKWD